MAIDHMRLAPRCGAKAKTTGVPCQGAAMANGRCRMHGGTSKGPPKGSQNALKHGMRTAEAIRLRKELAAILRANRQLVGELK